MSNLGNPEQTRPDSGHVLSSALHPACLIPVVALLYTRSPGTTAKGLGTSIV